MTLLSVPEEISCAPGFLSLISMRPFYMHYDDFIPRNLNKKIWRFLPWLMYFWGVGSFQYIPKSNVMRCNRLQIGLVLNIHQLNDDRSDRKDRKNTWPVKIIPGPIRGKGGGGGRERHKQISSGQNTVGAFFWNTHECLRVSNENIRIVTHLCITETFYSNAFTC